MACVGEMKNFCNHFLCFVIIFLMHLSSALAANNSAADNTVVLSPEIWSSPRSGQMVVKWKTIKRFVDLFDSRPNGRIIISHPGSDEHLLQAEELSAWLVALGIPSKYIDLRLGGSAAEGIVVELEFGDVNGG